MGEFENRFGQAMALLQARRFADAETIFRQLLALRPDQAEVRINFALAQLAQKKPAEAEASLRHALGSAPRLARGHFLLGDALSFQGRYAEAVASYRNAVRLKPDYVEAWNNLGNALLLGGQDATAADAYRKVIALKRDFPPAHNNLGLIHLAAGRNEEARGAFAEAVRLAPRYAEAHNNLGNALHKLGRGEEAVAALRQAIGVAPGYADAHVNLSAALYDLDRIAEAQNAAATAVRLAPGLPEGHNALGNALRELGRLAQAEACYREAVRLKPDYAEGHKHLAMALEEEGRLDEAFAHFRRHAQLDKAQVCANEPQHRAQHDMEQKTWLQSLSRKTEVADAPRLSGFAVNHANDGEAIGRQWREAKPQLVVIDNLLTAEALESLRRFCRAAPVWRKSYEGGYLGAFPEHGFAVPLIAQIAEELRAVYPAILQDHPLLHFWAFKYDSSLNGIKKHADFAAVNINFWITPDEANRDPHSGGLKVWDVAAPLDWDFAKYNAADGEILAFLEREQAKAVTIPYRANRAVIFDSDLFHETDTIDFKPGYENRRINVTLLYGRRHGAPGRFA